MGSMLFFFKQKTAYEMRISDWSSDVCSSDLKDFFGGDIKAAIQNLPAEIVEKIQIVDDYGDQANLTGNRSGDPERVLNLEIAPDRNNGDFGNFRVGGGTEERYQVTRSEEHTSELQSLLRISYPVFGCKKKQKN